MIISRCSTLNVYEFLMTVLCAAACAKCVLGIFITKDILMLTFQYTFQVCIMGALPILLVGILRFLMCATEPDAVIRNSKN